MNNFKYCIWACLDPNHPWEKYNNASRQGLHITIKSNIPDLKTATAIFNRIAEDNRNFQSKIFLDPADPIADSTDNFNSMFFKAYLYSNCNPYPQWWPLDAHISFYYSYGKEKLKNISQLFYNQKNIQKYNSATITNFKLVYCRAHFNRNWIVVKEQYLDKKGHL